MSKNFRIAIVGIGLVGRRHADAIRALRHVDLVAVVDPSDEGRGYAVEHGVACYETLEDLFANQSPDGVVLATPTTLHVDQGLACVRQGCPVLVEKPIAVEAIAALELVQEAEKSNVPLMVGHHRRHNPLIKSAKEAISDGKIGDVRAVHASCWFYKPDDYFDAAPWRKKPGAGPISVNLVHDVDLLRYLAGEVVSVQAQSTSSQRGYDNEDVAGALLTFEGGAIGTISVSDSIVAPWSWEMTSREYPIYPSTTESSYMIGGSHGSLSVPDLRLWSYHSGQRDWWTPISSTALKKGASDPLVNQLRHFVEVARHETMPLVSGREGLRTLQVIEAIQNSCRTGEVVRIDCLQQSSKAKVTAI
ncbi:Gfo/Idh/MocA family oxidoreductase [uncultured Ruegeria sp.]|uniref:Gfo/Idh/MocA family protein n=1 Tax=uncultured Ruegeria sp. TaxID=259304 RepID=UPI00261803DF|nr:Gfo/Idh/MocA family oxidoreductase [uncultured Ruegeria sp.]